MAIKPNDTVVALDDTDIVELLAKATAFDRMKKDAEAEFAKAADAIRALLGEATVGTVSGVEVVTNRWQNRSKTDMERLKKEFPEVYAEVVGTVKYRYLDRKPKHKK